MDVTKPFEFIGFGAMDVTKPHEFIEFGSRVAPTFKNQVPTLRRSSRSRARGALIRPIVKADIAANPAVEAMSAVENKSSRIQGVSKSFD